MQIPSFIKLKNNHLPDGPGVYFYYDENERLLYVGKAASLVRRVSSYFQKAHDARIEEMVSRIRRIEYQETSTVLEALVLEANEIKRLKPYYNILQRDDKSFLYLVVTNEPFPRPLLLRGQELEEAGMSPFSKTIPLRLKKKYKAVFGPYVSGGSLRKAMDIIRRFIPWSICEPPKEGKQPKACFYVHLGLCPGVCTGIILKKDYQKIIRRLIWFFEGKKPKIITELTREMNKASQALQFEDALAFRRQLDALNHIQDVALITRDEPRLHQKTTSGIDIYGRIEAYDISHLSGTNAVGSMTVLEGGKPARHAYRRFRIKTVTGINDIGMMDEMMRRRLKRAQTDPQTWPLPDVFVIDGGEAQVACVQAILNQMHITRPVVGLAKGFDRKQDRMVYDPTDKALVAILPQAKPLFQLVRDEAHRFAVAYQRLRREKTRGF